MCLAYVRTQNKGKWVTKKENTPFHKTWVTGSLPHLMSLKHLIEQLVKILKLTYESLRVLSGGRKGDYSILQMIFYIQFNVR